MSNTYNPTRTVWQGMVRRCTDPRSQSYVRYGAVGITVCERWKSYATFKEDMGLRPNGMTLDRIDSSRGYEPGNCRWVSWKEQNRNKRSTRLVTIDGETKCVAAWAEQAGVSTRFLCQRLKRGLTGRALLAPSNERSAVERRIAQLEEERDELRRQVAALEAERSEWRLLTESAEFRAGEALVRAEALERGQDVATKALAEVTRERDEARANYRFMVERAADEKLDGYRELASRLERAEASQCFVPDADGVVRIHNVQGAELIGVPDGSTLEIRNGRFHPPKEKP